MIIEYWVDKNSLYNIGTASEWNLTTKGGYTEEVFELKKRLTEETKLLPQLVDTIADMDRHNFKIRGQGVDLGGGSGWVSAILSSNTEISLIYIVDISEIRLEHMLPIALNAFGGEQEKVKPVVGSFYDIKLPNSSMDFIVMNQAFHHAKYPLKLLRECNRVLKKGGLLIITGEEPISERLYYAKLIYRVLIGKGRDLQFRTLFPASKMGDHHWRVCHYKEMFKSTGFAMRSFYPGYQDQKMSFVAKILGQGFYGNFYGLKSESRA